tara:strand:+ start:1652 stop:1885 length:234 start_codon:yes stop_codon:yes gene_type:complete
MNRLKSFKWNNFDQELYLRYLKARGMYKYRITYKYYKGNNTNAECCQAIKYITAYDRKDAINKFDLWKGLILKVEKL